MWRSFQWIGGDSIIDMDLRIEKGEKLQAKSLHKSFKKFCGKEKQRNGAVNTGAGKQAKVFYF